MIRLQQFTLQLHQPLLFTTYPGFYLRNALVKALTVHCREPGRVKDQKVVSCIGCSRAGVCLYKKLNLPVEVPEGIPGPMPFGLDVSMLHTGKYQSGVVSFGLNLYGRAGHNLQLFQQALEMVGRDYGIGEQGQARQFSVIGCDKVAETDIVDIFNSTPKTCKAVTLQFTHLKLPAPRMAAEKHLPLEYLLQQIQGRIQSLMDTYGGDSGRLPLLSITPEQAGNMYQTEQFALCNYQYAGSGKGHLFLSGQVKYQGDLTPWLQWLEAGSRVGVGRFTSYGFGKCKIIK